MRDKILAADIKIRLRPVLSLMIESSIRFRFTESLATEFERQVLLISRRGYNLARFHRAQRSGRRGRGAGTES